MTISTEVRKAGPFIGNDSASVFPFAFKVFKAADLIVVRRQDNIGEETTLILDSDYHVTLNGNQDTTPGGVVTLVAGALASGFTLVVSSELPYLQPTDLTNQGGFYPKVITNALDRLTIFCQQLAEITGRTLKLPITAPTNISAEIPLPNPSELIAWDETGTGLTTISPQSLVTSIAYGSATADLFAGDGVTTTFPLTTNPASVNNLDVSVGGFSQRPVQDGVGDYSWNGGASITFASPPPAPTVPGDKNVLVRYMQAIPVSDSEALHAQTREALRRGYAESGYTLVAGSFETGGTLTAATDVLLQESTGATYAWTGALPKVVAPGFDPVGVTGFELRTDVVLRAEITPSVIEALRRGYAEAGYNLVSGSFEDGGILANANDVLLYKANGKAYSGPAGAVTAGTNPTSGGFTDRSGSLLKELLSDIENAVRVDYTSSVPTVAALRLLVGSYEGQVVKTQSYRGYNLGGAEYVWRESITPTDNGVTILGSNPAGRWVMRSNGFVYDSQCGVLPTSLDSADQSDYYNAGLAAAPKVVSVYGNKADPINVTNGVFLADKAIIGVKIPFRTTGDTGTRWVSSANDKSQIRFSQFKLGQEVDSLILETTATGTPTRPAIEFNAVNEVTTAGIGARIKNTVAKGRWLQGLRIGGTTSVGWSWEVNIDNFQSEGHYSAGIEIGGFSANVSIINSKALLGEIANGAVAIRVKSGNVRVENFRSENNTWTLDLVGGHTEFSNLYSEGNRNGDIRSSGGSVLGGFMQAAHTNVGVTTEAVIKVISGVTSVPVIKVDKIALSVANGNILSYLDLLESNCYCEADFIWGSGVDTSGVNFYNISAEFNSRYAANRLGFPQYGFELRRREVQGETAWAFTANKLFPRGFFDSAFQFTLPRIDASGAAATPYNATRQYSTYTTSAQVDYVNTSSTPSSPTWVKRSTIQ